MPRKLATVMFQKENEVPIFEKCKGVKTLRDQHGNYYLQIIGGPHNNMIVSGNYEYCRVDKLNRLYFAYEDCENTGVIVSAKTNRQARNIGYNHGITGGEFLHTRCQMVLPGHRFYEGIPDEDSTMFEVTGDGPVFQKLTGVVEWDVFIKLLKRQGRYKQIEEDN